MSRFDYDDYCRDDYDEEGEPETEGEAGHRSHYRVVRKPRQVSCRTSVLLSGGRASHQITVNKFQANVGDLVRVTTSFTYNTEHHPDEPNIRTGYHKLETRVAFGPAIPSLAGWGAWHLSKKGGYAAYHGPLPTECVERDQIITDLQSLLRNGRDWSCKFDRSTFPGRTGAQARAAGCMGIATARDIVTTMTMEFASIKRRSEDWARRNLFAPAFRDSLIQLGDAQAVLSSIGKRLLEVEERRLLRTAEPGSRVTWEGRSYFRGQCFSKLVMHSNLEYAGGAGDCTVHTRFHLHAPEGADYPSTTLRY